MTQHRTAVLSRAQNAVLTELVRDGASNATIAARLYLTEETIKTHMKAIIRAFGGLDRAAIIAAYHQDHVTVRVVTRPALETT